MLDHYIQRNIVYKLAFTPGLRFSELKPGDLDNKLFNYHLKKVIVAGYVKKSEEGQYELTADGRRVGTRIFEKQLSFASRAESVLFLVIRRKQDGAWLLYRRTTHPLLGKVGFMHALPTLEQTCELAASRTCKEKTGLNANFNVLGGGYFKVFNGKELESFTHFNLLVSNDVEGRLQPSDDKAEYFWEVAPNFESDDMLPNMPILADLYLKDKQFFIEKDLQI
ncbi:hypothetical protein KDA00_03415 [Candidatus Saccharibacteria bacterium]|nr:hypothetical protein [Candidatus Saccharibacteria bacterium]